MSAGTSPHIDVSTILRAIGLLNLSIWFGAGIYFTVSAGPAAFSQDMKDLLGPTNYPYFSGAIAQLMIGRFFGSKSFAPSSPSFIFGPITSTSAAPPKNGGRFLPFYYSPPPC
jgi:hypothetical protein